MRIKSADNPSVAFVSTRDTSSADNPRFAEMVASILNGVVTAQQITDQMKSHIVEIPAIGTHQKTPPAESDRDE